MTLVLAAAVLAVVTSGMASASAVHYWDATDHSKLISYGYAPWSSYVNNEVSCSSGDTLKWRNTCENGWSGKSVYPKVVGGGFAVYKTTTISYGQTWTPEGSITASAGWHAIDVGHWYGNTYQGNDYASSGPQLISQPYQA